MPRYLIERTFQSTINLPLPSQAHSIRQQFLTTNNRFGVVWLYSYVSSDRKKAYCLYEAASPEALRRAAQHNRLPVERIIEVNVLDPYGLFD